MKNHTICMVTGVFLAFSQSGAINPIIQGGDIERFDLITRSTSDSLSTTTTDTYEQAATALITQLQQTLSVIESQRASNQTTLQDAQQTLADLVNLEHERDIFWNVKLAELYNS